jgi:hypothetical protein
VRGKENIFINLKKCSVTCKICYLIGFEVWCVFVNNCWSY